MDCIRYILILLLITGLFVPVSAIDLTGYDGYITPKFGASVGGEYWYKADFVNWYWATPSFESNNGYYDIFETEENIDMCITLDTVYGGALTVNIVCYDENYNLKEVGFAVSDLPIYSTMRKCKNVVVPNTMYGECFYYWELDTGYDKFHSNAYRFYLNEGLNTNWKGKRNINIDGSNNLSEGLTQIIFNDTEFYNKAGIFYVDDDSVEDTKGRDFSGTISNLVFTNQEQTKAYPYFINEYKGGYYEFNNDISNNTIIDLWINEEIEDKSITMFYDMQNFNSYAGDTFLYWGDSVNSGKKKIDANNNPFNVHQIFSDYRWAETQYINNIGGLGGGGYTRSMGLNRNTNIYTNPKLYVNIKQIFFSCWVYHYQSYDKYHPILNTNWTVLYSPTGNGYNLYNSSLTSNGTGGIYGTNLHHTYIENNKIYHNVNNINILSLNETKETFGELNYFGCQTDNLGIAIKLYDYYELPNNAITYNIGNTTPTDYAYINYEDGYEYDSFINDLWIGSMFSTDTSGEFYCVDLNTSEILGSIEIETDILNSFNIVFPYIMTNETKYFNSSFFEYQCKYRVESGGIVESDNFTINFTTNRIFLDTIKPTHQYNYLSQYVLYSINSELNYTGVQTDFTLTTNKIQCTKINNNGKCLIYNYLSGYNFYNTSNITKIYNYNEIKTLDVNNWYQEYYQFCRGGVCLSTPSRLFYVFQEEELISFPVEDFLDWNDTDLTEDTEFMQDMFWANPLAWFSSFIYQNFIVTGITDTRTLEIFKYVFFIFWSYLFILLVIWMGFLYKFKEHNESVKIASILTMPFFFLFAYLGWLGIEFVALMILLISTAVIYLWKR